MEIRNVIRFVTPLGIKVGLYVSEFDIRKLLNQGLISPCSYHLVLYGSPLIQEFVYDVSNYLFASFLLKPKNLCIYD